MYQRNEIKEPLQNDVCVGCKFCLWFDEEQSELCSIRGCFNNSKYKEFNFDEMMKEVRGRR